MASRERGWQPVELGSDVPKPAGAYSPVARAGNLIFVSGQVPRDRRTGELVGEGVEAQTRAVLDNLRAALAAAGASLDDVVSVTAYLADPGDWGKFNAVYRDTFSAPYPTRTAVGAALRGILVEVSCIAAVNQLAV